MRDPAPADADLTDRDGLRLKAPALIEISGRSRSLWRTGLRGHWGRPRECT